jgi:acyl-CoA thioesterase FadM
MSGFVETYRGSVSPWEVDIVGHLTVACYFERLEDATLAALEAIGLGPSYGARAAGVHDGRLHVRYARSCGSGTTCTSRAASSPPTTRVLLGHKFFNSETGAVCTTVEQRTSTSSSAAAGG